MAELSQIESRIASFLKSSHPSATGGVDAILGSQDLFTDGWMDSLLHLKLLAFLEKEFGLRVPPFQVTRRSFRTVHSVAQLVAEAR
jgi:acyl carrier protein